MSNNKIIVLTIVCFTIGFIAVLVGSSAIADKNDRMVKESIANAKEWKYMGDLGGEKVYFNQKEMKLDFKE